MAEQEMTLKQVARRLGVSEPTAWRRMKSGEIEVINVGTARRKRLRVTEEAYQKYIASRKIGRGRAA